MSVQGKIWKIKNSEKNVPTLEKLLKNRNILTRNEKIAFLKADFDDSDHSPFLFRDMNKAVERIQKAIIDKERVLIFGDYDVDGISGTAILAHIIKRMGGEVSFRLPHRVRDGYGLSSAFIKEFKEIDIKVLITVDCGISCIKEIEDATNAGIDVIITDHHTIPQNLPDKAHSILHPLDKANKYPFQYLTGAGVALKLGQALLEKSDLENGEDLDLIIKFASLGTVADLGPLYGENRTIVKQGLKLLKDSDWKGLVFLKKFAGIEEGEELTTYNIGYQIAPRINAAGRIDSPYIALKLLLSNDIEEAEELAEKLDQLNRQRQVMTERSLDIAEKLLDNQLQEETILVASSDKWHTGILGLIAGKLAEKYYRPTIIMEDRGEELIGSARSPEAFNIIEALTEQKNLLNHFGGHKRAAGFALNKDKLEKFKSSIQSYAKNTLDFSKLKPILPIDCEIDLNEVDKDLYEEIKELEPFGIENEEPVFLIKNVIPRYPKLVGNNQNHLKFAASNPSKMINAIGFNLGNHFNHLISKDKIDIVCSVGMNRWQGQENVQVKIIDFM